MFDFPWSNFHELNLDWILSAVKEAKEIFVKGEGDIQHAVETADQALETAEQAAAGVIADGAVTIPKINGEVFSLLAYCVSGSVAPNFIPAGALVILRKSTIYNVSDGIYTATRNIPQAAIITASDLDQSATLYREGGMNYLLHNEEKLSGIIDLIKAGLVILVNGDEASAAIPADGLAYVANNTHGLAEGFYFNSSGATFPTTGGTADGNSFTAVSNLLNVLQTAIATLGSGDIANDSTVPGASVTDALDAIKGTSDQLDAEKADEETLAYRRSGETNTGAQLKKGTFFYLDGTLKRAIATIAQNAAFTAQNCETVTAGGLNMLNDKIYTLVKIATATWNGITFIVTERGGVKELSFEGFCTNATSAGAGIDLTWNYEPGFSFADIHSATVEENFYKPIIRSDFSNVAISFYFGGTIQFYPMTADANTLFRGSFTYI